jgi:membrane protease YdiL (CAAX protease family)
MDSIEQNEIVDKPVWGFWATIGFGFVTGIIASIIQGLITITFLVVKLAYNPDLFTPEAITELVYNGLLVSIATVISAIVCVGFIALIVKIRKGSDIIRYLGLKSVSWKTYLILLAVSIIFLVLSSIIGNQMGVTDIPEEQLILYRTSVWPALLWIAVVIFAPLFEETLFRGFLFEGFRQSRVGIIGAIVLTALPWSLLHIQYEPYHIASIFVLGLIYGFVRYKTGSLWSTLFMHAFNNLAAMITTILYLKDIWT